MHGRIVLHRVPPICLRNHSTPVRLQVAIHTPSRRARARLLHDRATTEATVQVEEQREDVTAEDLLLPTDHMSPPTRHGQGAMIHTHQVEVVMAVADTEVVHMRAVVEDYHQDQEHLDKEVLAYQVGRDRRGDRFGLSTFMRSAGVGVGLMLLVLCNRQNNGLFQR